MTAPINDLDSLVARTRDGDLSAFEQLYRALHAPLRSFAAGYLGDDGRAEELVQDVFLDLWTSRSTWNVSGSVRAYLFAAVRNRALNFRRRDAVERDWADDEAVDDVRALHARPLTPDRLFDDAELVMRLRTGLAALPERCAMVMRLRWRDGMSYAEVASVLGITPKGVEKQLARGLRLLRERLGSAR